MINIMLRQSAEKLISKVPSSNTIITKISLYSYGFQLAINRENDEQIDEATDNKRDARFMLCTLAG